MLSYFVAAGWGLVLLAALVGWGTLARAALGVGPADRAQRAAMGLASATVIGGVLDAAHGISQAVVLAWVAVGVIVSAVRTVAGARAALAGSTRSPHAYARARERAPRAGASWSRAAVVLALAVGVVGTFEYCGVVSSGRHPGEVTASNFNNHDDFHAYLVFPRKMLATGTQGEDPFSERRLTTGLGGQPFLDTLVLAALSEQHLHIVDPALGSIVLVAVFLAWARTARVARSAALGAVFVFLLVPSPVVNVTALTTGAALYLALARLGPLPDPSRADLDARRNAGFVATCALLIAGAAALKATFLPAAALLGTVTLAWPAGTLRTRSARVLAGGTAALLLLVPWMISLHRSSGTYLFPLLGRGVRGPAPDPTSFQLDPTALLGVDPIGRRGLASLALVGLAWLLLSRRARRGGEATLAACAVVVVTVLSIGLRGVDLYRYAYFVVAPTAMVLGARAASVLMGGGRPIDARPSRPVRRAGAVVLAAGMLLFVLSLARDAVQRHRDFLGGIAFGMRGGTLDSGAERRGVHALQASIPTGATVLARLTKPYLMDFRRNPVYINDWPGGASPPPGVPAFQGSEALAAYLTRLGIRYVAYSYADEAGYRASKFAERLNRSAPPWIRNQTRYTLDFQMAVSALGQSRRRIYDDGIAFVLDLCAGPAGASTAPDAPATCAPDRPRQIAR